MLALIAGTGGLPVALYRHLQDRGQRPAVCAMHGFEPDVSVDHRFRLEHLGTFFSDLRAQGVTQICMAGAVKRPPIDPAQIDAKTMPLVPRLQGAMALGDDGTLREIIKILEEFGFEIIGASDLMPELLPPVGCLTRAKPDERHSKDVAVGMACIERLGRSDQGQACIVANGQLLAEEGPEGTAAMLAKFHPRTNDSTGMGADPLSYAVDAVLDMFSTPPNELPSPARGGLLYKAPKPNQERRVDLPVIGVETAMQAAEAGLAGIAIALGGVMVLDLDGVIETMNAQDMFLWVIE